MKPTHHYEEDVNKTLQSLEGLERATPQPFFVTRTEARLDHLAAGSAARSWVFRPAYLLASLGLAGLLNLTAVVIYQHQRSLDEQQHATESFVITWKLNSTTYNW